MKTSLRRSFPALLRACLPVLGFLLIATPLPSFCAEPAPGGIEWELTAVEDEDGGWWNAFKIATVPGVGYDIEMSRTLVGPWDTVASYYGGGMDVIHPLFPGREPSVAQAGGSPGDPPVVPAAGSPARAFVFAMMELDADGEVVLSWRSLDSGQPVRHALSGVTPDPVWEEFDGCYLNVHVNHMIAISPRLHSPVLVPDPPPVLGTADQDFVAAFTAALPAMTQNIAASVAAAALATPAPPPDPSAKGFFRIRADWTLDSDGDQRFDWQELMLDGHNPFNADTDGDGIPDNQDLPVFQIAATPAAPERPPVAKFQHRYVEASKELVYLGHHIGIMGDARRSDGQEWSFGDTLFDDMMQSENFQDLTTATTLFPIESEWQPGVVSLDAIHLEDVGKTEWLNFKCEYRLSLPEDAPAGGYEIPLVFAKIHYEWDGLKWVPAAAPAGQSTGLTVTLSVAEGERLSAPVSIPLLGDVGTNRRVTLVPADIAILAGSGATPADGLCVQMAEPFKLDFNGKEREAHECRLPDEWITWQVRRLRYDGEFEAWRTLVDPDTQAFVKGCEVVASMPDSYGCYQVRARISHAFAWSIDLQAVRMRDATNAINAAGAKNPKLAAGQFEYLGVANCDIAERVRNEAVKWLGSTAYAKEAGIETKPGSFFNPDLKGKNKCNIFVTHVANASGATTPYWYINFRPAAPIARDDWYTEDELHVDLDEPGWEYQGTGSPPDLPGGPLVPGMVVASHGSGTQGHCGIIDYDGSWINAGEKTVNKSIHATHPDPRYTDYRMRMRSAP